MYTLGHDFVPEGIPPADLDTTELLALSPALCRRYHQATSYGQKTVFDAAVMFAGAEGIIPAPESSHAIRAAIDEAVKAKEAGEQKVILFNLSSNGYFDMTSYDYYFSGNMKDVEYSKKTSKRV